MRKLMSIKGILAMATVAFMASCGQQQATSMVSDKTGWNFNDPQLGGYDVKEYNGQITAPGLVFVEGGRFIMGQADEDVTYDNNNTPHAVSVSSFYMDQSEVANVHYREYCDWVTRVFGQDYPNLIYSALPDSTCWRKAFQYNEPQVKYYFRHAAYNYYPVVGVSWRQANEYCSWRTDRVNELILMKAGFLKKNPNQVADDNFNTEAYLAGQYEGRAGVKMRDLNPTGSGKRNVSLSDGILLPDYRLPTEAEWEYAALGLIGQNPEPDSKRRRGEGVVINRQVYPWGDNNSSREGINNAYQGEFMANFRHGNDYMGIAGGLNDHADGPAHVYAYKPNAFGIYQMAGNVNEWVLDVYRPEAPDGDGYRVFRGNIYDRVKALEDGTLDEKDSLGRLPKVNPSQPELAERFIDYRTADLRDFQDGGTIEENGEAPGRNAYYAGGPESGDRRTTLITNTSRVYKGGGWADRQYWLSPGTRRFAEETHQSPYIGFRCAMARLGGPTLGSHSGNFFGGGGSGR
jgi:formylglycine-generating enzyme